MFESIFETVIKGSNTEFLDIPEEDYFLSYDSINYDAAEEITDNYFRMKGKDGIPSVKGIDLDPSTHTIKITLEVKHDRDHKLQQMNIPDVLNINRRQ